MNEQKPAMKWFTKIDMETVVDKFINQLATTNNIFDIDYIMNHRLYGDIHFKSVDNNLFVNFKKSKRPCLLKNDITDNCCICYDDCNKTLKCGHYICKNCIQWIQTNNSCPLCRRGDNYNIGYIFCIPFKAVRKLIY